MLTRTESDEDVLTPGGRALVLDVNQSKIALHIDSQNRRMWVGDNDNYLDATMMSLFRFIKVPNHKGYSIWIMVKNHQVMEDEFGEEVKALIEYFQSLAN
jgi:hypothetical protein